MPWLKYTNTQNNKEKKMKLNEKQMQEVGKAIQMLFISRNQVINGDNTIAWIELLSEKLTYEQILKACKYFCYHGDNFISVPVILSHFKKSPEKQAELEWGRLNSSGASAKANIILRELIGGGNSLDRMSSYQQSDIKKQFIALYTDYVETHDDIPEQAQLTQAQIARKRELELLQHCVG